MSNAEAQVAIDPALTSYERRLWVEIDRILYQNYLTPRTVTDFWAGDRDAIIWHLKSMKIRIIRTIVLGYYVELDDTFNSLIWRQMTGPKSSNRGKRNKILRGMLDKLYLLQKLDIIRSVRTVPKGIASSVMALNDLRNTLAHRFDLTELPKNKRLYKARHDVFTKGGLKQFRDDMWDVDEFFRPHITRLAMDAVKAQRAATERADKS